MSLVGQSEVISWVSGADRCRLRLLPSIACLVLVGRRDRVVIALRKRNNGG